MDKNTIKIKKNIEKQRMERNNTGIKIIKEMQEKVIKIPALP